MLIPPECPECGDPGIDVVTVPPTEHDYEGWQTAVECDTCDNRVFARTLDA
jgi:hypothetical protein